MSSPGYAAYLKTEEWRETRIRYQQHYTWKCWICGGYSILQLHHVTYERFRAERLTDFRPLCQGCHHLVHKWHPVSGKNLREATEQVRSCFKKHQLGAGQGARKKALRILEGRPIQAKNRPTPNFSDRFGGETKVRFSATGRVPSGTR